MFHTFEKHDLLYLKKGKKNSSPGGIEPWTIGARETSANHSANAAGWMGRYKGLF